MSGGQVQLESLTKRFDEVTAVDDLSLAIDPGEFLTLLGPSGCGKTTTLRMIAGFEPPTGGRILLDGTDVTNWPANRRNVNTVFQSYALFPFLNVTDNVAFGLKYKSVRKAEREAKVAEALALVQLSGYERRRPNQLSGGQQQRVALARALILRPSVLLLDEPLGALDAQIRKQLRVELKSLQEEVGITFVFVTHDQEEALSMSDRIAVMSNGRIEQLGTPEEVYEDPQTVFTANFLGVSNLMDAEAVGGDADHCIVRVGEVALRAGCGTLSARGPVKIVARPERIELYAAGGQPDNALPAMVERTVYVGPNLQVMLRLPTGAPLQASITNTGGAHAYQHGTAVAVQIPPDALRVLAGEAAASAPASEQQESVELPA